MPDDFRVSITNAPGKTAYPISSFTWLLIPEKFSDATKRDAVKTFLKWALKDGQNYAENLSYAKLPKPVVDKELKAIDKIVAGEGFVDPALMPAFLSGDREDMLTAREREILQLLADGMSNADVAGRLFISQETVKSHVRHILTKLEADTRTHAVAIALRDAIID